MARDYIFHQISNGETWTSRHPCESDRNAIKKAGTDIMYCSDAAVIVVVRADYTVIATIIKGGRRPT